MVSPVITAGRRAYRAYRASGADLPSGDLLPAHDVAMEGYFWRFTDPASGRVVIALDGVNRASGGVATIVEAPRGAVLCRPGGISPRPRSAVLPRARRR